MSFSLKGVQLEADASQQMRELEMLQRERVAHVLEEMVAVVELTAPSIHLAGLAGERLHFSAAGVRVEYSIDCATALLIVHEIADAALAPTG